MAKYPFTPEVLDSLPEEIAEYYRQLEIDLLEEICSRLNISGQINQPALEAIKALRSHGIPLKDIKREISRQTGIADKELDKLLTDVIDRNKQYYDETADATGITLPDRWMQPEDIDAIARQTKEDVGNITRSMGFALRVNGQVTQLMDEAEAYRWALNQAEMRVQSGVVSYNVAIRDAVKQLADSGLKTVVYDNNGKKHYDQVDVAVRRAVMTGTAQIAHKYTEQSVEYLETDLVEVSAHVGARDVGVGPMNHKEWQGKVYQWVKDGAKRNSKYLDFERVTGYGTGEGLGGYNCRHSFSPFIEGVSERTYTDEQLENIDPEPFEYEGKTYTAYEATQKQRQIERTIRKLKREREAFKAAGLKEDATAVNAKIRRLNAKYKDFSQAAGLPLQPERMKVQYVDNLSTSKAQSLAAGRARETERIRAEIKSGKYPLTLNPEKQSRHMVGSAVEGRSVITLSSEELQEVINKHAGSGELKFAKRKLEWAKQEIIDAGKETGYTVSRENGIIKATKIKVHYSKTGTHAVPYTGG